MTIKNAYIGLLSLCLFFNTSFAQPTAPEIYIDPSFAEAWVYPVNQYFWTTTISNLGNSDLSYSFPGFSTGSPPPGFVFSVQPATGIIPPGGSEDILIGWDPSGYSPGVYYQDVICESNDPANPTMIISNKMNLGQMAYLTGTIIDAATQQPLEGVEVFIPSSSIYSLSDGTYLLPVYPYNAYVVYFEKLGYHTNFLSIPELNPGDTLIQDISLEPAAYPVPWVTADPVDCNDPVPSQINWTLPTGPTEVSYDDGSYEDIYAWALPGGECAVKFSPNSYPCQIIGGRVQVGDGSWPTANWMGSSFTVVIYDEDVNGMPANVLDSFPVVVNNYGWVEFWSIAVELNSGNFFLSFKQVNASPNCAPVGIDLDAPLENRSYMKAPGGSWQFSVYQDFMIRAFVDQVSLPSNVTDFTLARISDFDPNMGPQPGTMTILADTTATYFEDNDFPTLPEDWYAYAVRVNYNYGQSSQWTYSNIIGMHKGKIVEFHLNDCLGLPVSGAEITLWGEDYPFVWFQDVTDSSGSCIFECTWAGTYTYEIEKFGFDPIQYMNIHIVSDTIIGFEWNEITWAPRNLNVDDISGSMDWDDPVVMALSEDFEGSMLQYPWQMTSNGQGWFLTTNGSSLNFPVLPWNSQYICVNDDALGSGNDGSVDYLITPPLDLRGTDEFHMTFDSFFTGVNGQLATVEYSEDAGASWEVFYNISPDMYWSSIDLDLSSICGVNAPGVNWFAFHADDGGGQGSGWAIDNVEILAEIIVTDNYQVFLDSTLIATTDTNFYQFEGLTFGQEYTACVAAVYPCGVSDLVCVDFTSYYLRAPEWINGDSAGNQAELSWFMDTLNILDNLLGYNVYRDSVLIEFVAFNGGDTNFYTDTPPDPMCYDYHVSALYADLTSSDTLESAYTGPEEVCLVFGAMLPISQDWTSGAFEPDWTAGDNWVVNGQIGNAEPSAEFTWDPILNDYEECIVSGPINGLTQGAKNGGTYIAGRFVLEFDIQLDNVNPTGAERLDIEIYSDGEWQLVSTFNNANGSFEWDHQEIDITDIAFGNIFKLRFMARGNESSNILSWFIDNILIERRCDPPESLVVEAVSLEEIDLNWSPPYYNNAEEWMSWDDSTHIGGIGLNGGGVFSVAARWDADMITQYDGQYITNIRFFPYENAITTGFTIKVWKGASAANLVYEEVLGGLVIGAWNDIPLATPVMIDASQELWFGYTCDQPDGENPAGHDSGPAVAGYGDMITLDGIVWDPISSLGSQFNHNWNIQALVSNLTDDPINILTHENDLTIYSTPNAELLNVVSETIYVPINLNHKLIEGYHVYFNNDGAGYEFIGRTQDTFYIHINEDQFIPGGLFCYYVKAVYEDCEADSDESCWITTGIEMGEPGNIIRVYPNPTYNLLNIESSEAMKQLSLLDLSGHTLIIQEAVHQKKATMDVSSLARGVYLLSIDTEEGRAVRKIIIE